MPLFPLGFRTKIALLSAAASGFAVLAFSATSAFIVFDNMMEEADAEVMRAARQVASHANSGDLSAAKNPGVAQVSAEPAQLQLIELIGPVGEVVIDRKPAWTGSGELPYQDRPQLRTIRAKGEPWRIVAHRHPTSFVRVKLAIDLREITLEVTRMVKTYLLALPAAMAIAALGGWWVARRAAKPIRAITRAAEKISAERFERRVPALPVRDDISRLAAVLNETFARLQQSYAQAQRFSADASHELRTPIAVLQGKIEQALQSEKSPPPGILADLGTQVARLKAIVESLLLFTRADAGQLAVGSASIDLRQLLDELREDIESIAEPAGVQAEFLIGTQPIWVKGDERLLRIALFNILQNAVKYTPALPQSERQNSASAGSNFPKITCEAISESGKVKIRVKNPGPQINQADRESIFDRFWRSPDPNCPPVPGTGLGLSLARTIARVHGGEVSLIKSQNGWNEFEFKLPEAEP